MSRLAVQTFKTWKKYIIHTKSNLKHLLQQFSLWFLQGYQIDNNGRNGLSPTWLTIKRHVSFFVQSSVRLAQEL